MKSRQPQDKTVGVVNTSTPEESTNQIAQGVLPEEVDMNSEAQAEDAQAEELHPHTRQQKKNPLQITHQVYCCSIEYERRYRLQREHTAAYIGKTQIEKALID